MPAGCGSGDHRSMDTYPPYPATDVRPPTSPLVGAVAAVCVYEVAAVSVNHALQHDLLPSLSSLIQRTTVKGVASRAVQPPWVRGGGALGFGLVAGVAGAALSRRGRGPGGPATARR
jgi:hypothetical protein